MSVAHDERPGTPAALSLFVFAAVAWVATGAAAQSGEGGAGDLASPSAPAGEAAADAPETPRAPSSTGEPAGAASDAALAAAPSETTAAAAPSAAAADAATPSESAPSTAAALAVPTPAALVPAAGAAWVEPEPEPAEPPASARFGGRAYVARYALRPLTVGEGVLRIDNGSAGRIGGSGGFGIVASVALGAHLGITDDLEVGFSWAFGSLRPGIYDPVIGATLRFFHDTAIDVGVRTSIRAPFVTNGDTVWRFGVPVVVRGGNWLRVSTAVDMDLLFASNVSPLLSIPLQVAFSTGDGFSLGPEGWFALLDGRAPAGSIGGFVQITHRTPLRALLDVRLAATYLLVENAVQITTAVSFYPQLW